MKKTKEKEKTATSVGAELQSAPKGARENQLENIVPPTTQDSKKFFQTIDAESLLLAPLPPTQFVIDELLPQGLNILAGSAKIGKSWLGSKMGR